MGKKGKRTKEEMKFEINNLSAGQADCFLIKLENNKQDQCNILVDGNGKWRNTYRYTDILNEIKKLTKLDYIVVTHVDDDHIGGVLKLLNGDTKDKVDISSQLKETAVIYNCITKGNISYKQATELEALLEKKKVISSYSQRYDNNGMLKFYPVNLRKLRESVYSEETAYFTFFGPDKDGVNQVIDDYNKKMPEEKSGKAELINRYSITFMLEFAGKRVLFLGDAYMQDVIPKYIEIYSPHIKERNDDNEAIWKIDLIKIPHHGAENNNIGLKDFAKEHHCNMFLVTGDEEWTDEKHPAKSVMQSLKADKTEIYTEVDLEKIDKKLKDCKKASPIKLV